MDQVTVYNTISIRLLNILLGIKNVFKVNGQTVLKNNKKWKNKYAGKRCFIVGNGPSLRNQDLSLIHDEISFTLNQIMKSEKYEQINSNFHIMMDPLYFEKGLNGERKEDTVHLLKSINYGDHKPECFFPLSAMGNIKKNGLDELRINYLYSYMFTYEGFNEGMDIDKKMMGFRTVAQYAIAIAIYMGFSEIYLLGCDMTGYKEVEQYASNSYYGDTHVYDESEADMKNALHNGRTAESYFDGFSQMFTDYRRIYEYTERKGIKLINLTDGGILDSIPRMKYEDIVVK